MGDQLANLFRTSVYRLQYISMLLLVLHTIGVASKCVLFNFGDSNTDTGAITAALGVRLRPPNGQQFFNQTAGRFCNGRLYIDFLCDSLKINFLSPYLESSGSDFSHGVNFAVTGASTEVVLGNPFSMTVQSWQFGHFQNRTRELRPLGKGSKISEEDLRNAVFSIDMGQNDITIAITLRNNTFQQYLDMIPTIIGSIGNATADLYRLGGRKFWIYNTGPMGCLPQTLAMKKRNDTELDEAGCMVMYNNASKALNDGLSNLCDDMRSNLKDATIVLTDMYSIKYDLFANPKKYGFENPLMACCGFGGPPYNYVSGKACGQSVASACNDPSRSVSWDGVHYSEAANAVIASKILSGNYSSPVVRLTKFCARTII